MRVVLDSCATVSDFFLFKLALSHPTPASSTQNIQKRRRIDPLAASDDEGKEGVQLILAAGDFEDDSEDAEEPTDADKQAEPFASLDPRWRCEVRRSDRSSV